MDKNKKQITDAVTPDTKITPAVEAAAIPNPPVADIKPKHTPAQIKQLLKDYSKVTLKARGII